MTLKLCNACVGWPCRNPEAHSASGEWEHAKAEVPENGEFLSWNQIKALARPEWRIEGWLPVSGVGHIYGDSGTYKSTWALQAGYCIAAGLDFCGCPVKEAPVVYIVGEDLLSFRLRALALEQHYGVDIEDKFFLRPCPTQLDNSMVVEGLAKRILGVCPTPGVIFVDTLRTNFEGEENSSDVMNKVTSSCKLLARITGALVILVHHVGKDEGRGARGSSALKCDHDIVLKADWDTDKPTGEFIREKCRGMPRAVGGFKRTVLEVDPEGDFSEGVVLEETFELTMKRPAKDKAELNDRDQHVMAMLEKLAAVRPSGRFTRAALIAQCDPAIMTKGKTQDATRKAVDASLAKLEKLGRVKVDGPYCTLTPVAYPEGKETP